MKTDYLTLALIVICLATGASSAAQQKEGEITAQDNPTDNSQAVTDPDNVTQPDSDPPTPVKTVTPTRFTPSEKIRADDAVSFPVDI